MVAVGSRDVEMRSTRFQSERSPDRVIAGGGRGLICLLSRRNVGVQFCRESVGSEPDLPGSAIDINR